MSIVRRGTPLERNFYILDKAISEDSRLSFEARGLLIFLLGKPDSWEVSIQHLVNESPAGKDKVARMLKELRNVGYVTCEKYRNDNGRLAGYVYTVFESSGHSETPEPEKPETENPVTVKTSPEPEKPETEKPEAGKPETANPLLVSTDNKQVLNQASNKPTPTARSTRTRKTQISYLREDHDFTDWTNAGIPNDVIDAWLLNRQNKNLPVTPLATGSTLKSLQVSAAQHPQFTLVQILTIAINAGWGGFEPNWFTNRIQRDGIQAMASMPLSGHMNTSRTQQPDIQPAYASAEASVKRLSDISWGDGV